MRSIQTSLWIWRRSKTPYRNPEGLCIQLAHIEVTCEGGTLVVDSHKAGCEDLDHLLKPALDEARAVQGHLQVAPALPILGGLQMDCWPNPADLVEMNKAHYLKKAARVLVQTRHSDCMPERRVVIVPRTASTFRTVVLLFLDAVEGSEQKGDECGEVEKRHAAVDITQSSPHGELVGLLPAIALRLDDYLALVWTSHLRRPHRITSTSEDLLQGSLHQLSQ
mmetsp:Transcript_11515/g.24386  ORF Transcript_11515/g.24386 Transcript_11515/m.24386 type:complete len:222 (-) Transcript_11515:2220-2885(-)